MRAAQDRELAAWKKFDACPQVAESTIAKTIVGARWVFTWKVLQRKTRVQTRLVTKGFQGPDLQQGPVDTARCGSLRSSHLQLMPLRAMRR